MSDTQKTIQDYLDLVKETITRLDHAQLEKATEAFMRVHQQGGTVYVMGNGGSAATSTHIAGDMVKGASFGLEKRFRVMSLTDNMTAIMAIANDISYDDIFVEQIKNFLKPGDLVLGISGSGNSKNVVKALEYARSKDIQTIAFCGYKGGHISQLADIVIHAQVMDMEVAEDIHMVAFHTIKKEVMRRLMDKNPSMGGVYDERVKK
jgi:D-sedoheptulose 7-phosphate isomerase